MLDHLFSRKTCLGLVVIILSGPSTLPGADTIHSGWDLLQTQPSTQSPMNTFWLGLPLGTFDFGQGPTSVGTATDTILLRLGDAVDPGGLSPVNLSVSIAALQWVTPAPTHLYGGDLGLYYLTLQSLRGGMNSGGTLVITFDPTAEQQGTFTSSLNLNYDVRFGALDGPIVASDSLVLVAYDVPWSHLAPTGATLIDGKNDHLNGTDTSQDFWEGTTLDGTAHPFTANEMFGKAQVTMAVPEPGPALWLLAGAGLLGLRYGRGRGRAI